jgi:hypothetical protein
MNGKLARASRSVVLAGLLIFLCANESVADPSDFLRVVALSRSPAPGAPGAVFGALTPGDPNANNFDSIPVLSNSGHVSFIAQLQSGTGGVSTNNDKGIWLERSGMLELVAREGDQAPGLPSGARYTSFGLIASINTAGQIAFTSSLEQGTGSVTSSNDQTVWSDVGGPLHLVVREGDSAPGTPSGSTFRGVLVTAINDSGQLALRGAANISAAHSDGLWIANANGSINPVVIEGNAAPGPSFQARFDAVEGLAFNREGQMAFSASVGNASVPAPSQYNGVWVTRAGSLQMVALQNDIAPGTSATFNDFDYYPQMNDSGHVAFAAYLSDAGPGVQIGIWSDVGGSLQKVAATGDQAPGLEPGVKLNFVDKPVIANSGRIVFDGSLEQNGSSLGGTIWSYQNGATETIALKGDHAPGTPTEDMFIGASRVAINKSGRIAFSGYLQIGVGDVTSANSSGIWAEDTLGQLQLIVRRGDSIDVDKGPGIDLRTVASFAYFGNEGYNNPGNGHQGGFNDLGQFAFVATFTDGSSGIFVSNLVAVPEPSALCLLAFCIAYWLVSRFNKLVPSL